MKLSRLGLLGLVSLLSYTAMVVFSPLTYPGYDWRLKMKKITVCILAFLMMSSLCACGRFSVPQQDATGDTKIMPSPTEEPEVQLEADDLIGPWYLGSTNNDLGKIAELFAGYAEWGASMEIRSDGKISWYIGAVGGSGTYAVDGDTLTAVLQQATKDAASAPQDWTVDFKGITVDRSTLLAMNYGETTALWSRGEAPDDSAMEESWKAAFEASLFEGYGVMPERYEDLGDGFYQVYVVIDGNSVPYVTVNSATGDYHG